MTITSGKPNVNNGHTHNNDYMSKSMRDVYFKFGTINKGSADFGLYWSPLTEEHVLVADGDNAQMIEKIRYILSEFGENSQTEYVDFGANCDDSEKVLEKSHIVENLIERTKLRSNHAKEELKPGELAPLFVVINGFDKLAGNHRHNQHKLSALDNVFWLLQNGFKGRVHVILGVENAENVPSFIQSHMGLKLYAGLQNIVAAENKFGPVETYRRKSHQGVAKTYISDSLFPVSRFFDDITD